MENDYVELEKLGARLQSWRDKRTTPAPLPETIWAEAAELSRRLGLTRVSKALRLDYGRLKRLSLENSSFCPTPPGATFVELVPKLTNKCLVEVESAGGAKMKIQMENADYHGLAALVREFVA